VVVANNRKILPAVIDAKDVSDNSTSVVWRMKLPRELHARVKKLAEAELREINNMVIVLLMEAMDHRKNRNHVDDTPARSAI
jgi:hypothetical protein